MGEGIGELALSCVIFNQYLGVSKHIHKNAFLKIVICWTDLIWLTLCFKTKNKSPDKYKHCKYKQYKHWGA